MRLKRELNLFDTALLGIGITVGAGIYSLIGEGIAIAGPAIWISFVVAAVICILTGLSAADLARRFPMDSSVYLYVKRSIKSKTLGFISAWLFFWQNVIAISVVSLAFAFYLNFFIGISPMLIAVSLIVFNCILVYIGAKTMADLNDIITFVSVGGLLLIIGIGLFKGDFATYDYFYSPGGMKTILSATALVIFAYLGFEMIATTCEEVKNPKKTVPRAIIISILVSSTLYILTAVSMVALQGWTGYGNVPILTAVGSLLGKYSSLVAIFPLAATYSTVLLMIFTSSRLAFGLAEERVLPKAFMKLSRFKTPTYSIILVAVISIIFLNLGNIATIARTANFSAMLVFLMINVSSLILKYREGSNIFMPLLGCVATIWLMFSFTLMAVLSSVAVSAVGYLIYYAYKKENMLFKR